jgi:polysaccharide biosynthesis/export protein
MTSRMCLIASGLMLLASSAGAQALPGQTPQRPAEQPPNMLRPNYVLGPGDQVIVRALNVEEVSERPFPIDGDGNIDLPLLGPVKAAGLTVSQLEAQLIERLKKYVNEPQVTVTVVQFRSEPVFLVGAFKAPGIYSLQGNRSLIEMISVAGGLLPNASRRIKVTRRNEFGKIPLPNVQESTDGKETFVTISMASLRDNVNPAEDILLQPFDVITVERAEMIYVNGAVGRPGGFELAERDSMSVVQVLSLAGGIRPDGNPRKARVLRPVLSSSQRAEIPLDLDQIMAGKASDFVILPNDLLFVPQRNAFARNTGRIVLIAVPLAITLTISLLLR